jgi:hypothetical protein
MIKTWEINAKYKLKMEKNKFHSKKPLPKKRKKTSITNNYFQNEAYFTKKISYLCRQYTHIIIIYIRWMRKT